jgi:hypothetical protein
MFRDARTYSVTLCGCCDPHFRTLCLFTAPEMLKVTSSENMMFVGKMGSPPMRSSMSQTKMCRSGVPSGFNSCIICTLYAQRDTIAFGEAYAHFRESRLPLTSDERHTDVLCLLIGVMLSVSSVPFQGAPSLRKLVLCFDPLCFHCCSLINTTGTPFALSQCTRT